MVRVKDFLAILINHDTDICVIDNETGEHYIGYFSLEDKGNFDEDCHKWLCSLKAESYQNDLLVVQSPFSCDETEFLINGMFGEYETKKWYENAKNMEDIIWKQKYKFVKEGKNI